MHCSLEPYRMNATVRDRASVVYEQVGESRNDNAK